MNERSRRPTAETIVPRFLAAVERLCAERSPEKVGMRDIAAEAGLSVGVAYRYFESRTALFGAALEHMGERLAVAATSSDDPAAMMQALWKAFSDNPAFVRIGSAAILDGQNVSKIMSKHPAARDLAAAAAAQGIPDPQTFTGVVLTLGLGGAFYGTSVNRALQRSDQDQRLYQAAAEMVAAWVSSAKPETSRRDSDTG